MGAWRLLAVAVAASVAAGACGTGDAGPPPASGIVRLYTSMPEPIVAQLEGVFEGAFPDFQGNTWIQPRANQPGGIDLRVTRARTADIEALIESDIAAGGVKADVIWLAEPSRYEEYKSRGLLAPYAVPPDAPVPAEFVDPDGYFVAGRVISMVLAWDPERVPGGVHDWPELLWQGATAFPSPASGAARATIKALIDTYGHDFFTSFKTMGGVAVADNEAARDGLVSGQYEAVVVLDYLARLAKTAGEPIDFAYPASGTVAIPSPLAITSDSANPDAARVFVDYVLSRTGQEIVVELGSFYPVRTDVSPPQGTPPLDAITRMSIDWSALAGEIGLINGIWESLYPADEAG